VTVAGVVLAAGAGTRYVASGGVGHKLLALVDGQPLVVLVQRAALAAGLDEVMLVEGALDLSAHCLEGVTLLRNDRWAEGIATSLQTALGRAAAVGHGAVVVGLADQPGVAADDWRTMAAASDVPPIAVAVRDGRRGNPVRLARAAWPFLPDTGDEGARALMRERPDLVQEVPCASPSWDVDTADDLERPS
jgi:CTP:molybdopterin cytidylyltransferase MocA